MYKSFLELGNLK